MGAVLYLMISSYFHAREIVMKKNIVIAAIIGFIVGWLTAGSVLGIINSEKTRRYSWNDAWRRSDEPAELHLGDDGKEDDSRS